MEFIEQLEAQIQEIDRQMAGHQHALEALAQERSYRLWALEAVRAKLNGVGVTALPPREEAASANPFKPRTYAWYAYELLWELGQASLPDLARRMSAHRPVTVDGLSSTLYRETRTFEKVKPGIFQLRRPV